MAMVWEQRRECVEFMHVFPLLQEGHFRLCASPLLCRRVDVPSDRVLYSLRLWIKQRSLDPLPAISKQAFRCCGQYLSFSL